MLNLLTLHLHAIHQENNIFRKYEIYAGKDLFGNWAITTANGRIGTAGHLRTYPLETFERVQKRLQQLLKKRQSAPKRIGTNYEVISYSYAENIWGQGFVENLFHLFHPSPEQSK